MKSTTLKERNKLRNSAQHVIINPQNALSIDNPDDLLLVDGILVGLIYPNSYELKNHKRLLRRILNSRLTYSSELKIALIIDEQSDIMNNQLVISSVDTIIHPNETSRFTNRIKHPNQKVLTFSKTIKDKALDYFERNLAIYESNKHKKLQYKSIILSDYPIAKYNGKLLKFKDIRFDKIQILDSSQNLILKNYEGSFISLKKSLQTFFTDSFFLRFDIENDEINTDYQSSNDYMFFNSNLNNLGSQDITKICFAGFVPISINQKEECIEVIKDYINGKKKNKY